MNQDESTAEHCRRCIAEEERLGNESPTREAGERHFQLAMLYRAQLRVLERRRARRAPYDRPGGRAPDRAAQSASIGH